MCTRDFYCYRYIYRFAIIIEGQRGGLRSWYLHKTVIYRIKCGVKRPWESHVQLHNNVLSETGENICADGQTWGLTHHWVVAQLVKDGAELGAHLTLRSAWATPLSI